MWLERWRNGFDNMIRESISKEVTFEREHLNKARDESGKDLGKRICAGEGVRAEPPGGSVGGLLGPTWCGAMDEVF